MTFREERWLEIFKRESERLGREDFRDIAARFQEALLSVMTSREEDFINWMMIQAPIKLLHPSSDVTAAAGTDGYIYINPAYWSSIISWHIEECAGDRETAQEEALPDLKAMIIHEMGHLLLRHPWTAARIMEEVGADQNYDQEKLRLLANICMDFVINTGFCVPLFPQAKFLNSLGLKDRASFKEALENAFGDLPNSLDWLFQEPDLEKWNWEDLFFLILKHLPAETMRAAPGLGKVSQGVPGEGETVGVHGEKLDSSKSQLIRRGALGGGEKDPEQAWERAGAEALNEIRNAGDKAGKMARALEATFEVVLPWKKLLKKRLSAVLGQTHVRQTWCRPSRKHPEFPHICRVGKGELWFLLDVSGSVAPEELRFTLGIVLSYLKRTGGRLRLVPWDAEVKGDYLLQNAGQLRNLEGVLGGGGTVLFPALAYVKERVKQGDAISICTDSALQDISSEATRGLMVDLARAHGPFIWIHFGTRKDWEKIYGAVGRYVKPVLVDNRARIRR